MVRHPIVRNDMFSKTDLATGTNKGFEGGMGQEVGGGSPG